MLALEAVEQVGDRETGTLEHVLVVDPDEEDVSVFHKPSVDDADEERSCND